MLSFEFIQFLNDTAKQYFPVNSVKINDKYNFRCPFCGDSKKSQTKKRGWWYLKNATYYCFNCGISLSGIKFIKLLSGNNFQTIKKNYLKLYLKSNFNNKNKENFENSQNKFQTDNFLNLKPIIKQQWKQNLSEDAKKYLNNRQILNAPFLKNKFYSYYFKNKEFILIPWIVNSVEAFYQLNDFHQYNKNLKYIFPFTKQKLIFGLDNIDISFPYIFVFEGVYDSIFVKNGVASGTKSLSDYQYKLLKWRYPKHQIVISFDNDKAGFIATKKLINKNNDFKYFKWYNLKTKQKDINEYIVAKNKVNIFTNENILKKLIINKLSMKIFLLKNNLWSLK